MSCPAGLGAVVGRRFLALKDVRLTPSVAAIRMDEMRSFCPLDWRLFVPEEWDEDSEFNDDRRVKAGVPDDLHHVEKWRLALQMIDELTGWELAPG